MRRIGASGSGPAACGRLTMPFARRVEPRETSSEGWSAGWIAGGGSGATLGSGLSKLEADALKLYLEGESYETMAERLGCDTKTIDNALQRVKRKILTHQEGRQVLQ